MYAFNSAAISPSGHPYIESTTVLSDTTTPQHNNYINGMVSVARATHATSQWHLSTCNRTHHDTFVTSTGTHTQYYNTEYTHNVNKCQGKCAYEVT